MAIDVQFNDITNATTLTDGTGYFDKLMKTINLYIEDQYKKGRLKGPDYATVYLGSLQTALQTAEQFTLAEKMQEAQIAGIEQDNLLKAEQLIIAQKELELKTVELGIEQYKLDNIVPKELEQLNKQIDVTERGMVIQESELADKLSTSAKQRILLDEEKETSDKQQLLLDVQKDSETYKKDTLLVDEHNTNLKKLDSITKDIDVKERSTVVQESELADKLITAEKQRIQLDVETKLAEQKVVGRKQSAVTAE